MTTRTAPHIRWMIRRDMPRTLEIERACFGIQAWSESDFIRVLRQRDCIGMVAEGSEADRISGYMLYELHRNHIDLLNLAVDPAYQRKGVGLELITRLWSKLHPERRSKLTTRVCESNLPAQLFFRWLGFRAVGVDRGYFDDGQDAYRFEARVRRD